MALAIYILSWRNGTSSLRIILIGIGLSALARRARRHSCPHSAICATCSAR